MNKFVRISIVIFFLPIVLPNLLSFHLGSLYLTPLKICSILVTLLLFIPYLNVLNREQRTYILPDIFMFFHLVWVFVSLSVNHNITTGIEAGGFYFLEIFPFYMLGRMIILRRRSVEFFLKLAFWSCLYLGIAGWIESVFRLNIINGMFGISTQHYDERFGLSRAYASFDVPILLGLYVSAFVGFALYYYRSFTKLLVLLFALVPPLSSAPLLAAGIQFMIYGYDRLFRPYKKRWVYLLSILAIAYILVSLLSSRGPLTLLINNLTFNSQTAFYRTYIWEFGVQTVENNPIFGIGYNDWARPFWMTDSVDAFWLFIAMKFGIPGLSALLLMKLLILKRVGTAEYSNRFYTVMRRAWLTSIAGTVFVGLTVHFWSTAVSMYAILLGIGAGLQKQGDAE